MKFILKPRKKSKKSSLLFQSTIKPNMFDYGFEAGKNFDVYYPKNNLKNILKSLENSAAFLKKKKLKERRSSKHSNFFILKNRNELK